MPLLARLGFDRLVAEAGYPGSEMVPALSALLSLLALKLLDKERRSHIDDFNCDEALGLFAGLNVLPKKIVRHRLLLPDRPRPATGPVAGMGQGPGPGDVSRAAEGFSLDFHPIPFRGDPAALDRHYLPLRGKAGPSVLTFFALEQNEPLLVLRQRQPDPRRSARRTDAVRRVLARGRPAPTPSGSTSTARSSTTPNCRASTNGRSISSPSADAGRPSSGAWNSNPLPPGRGP